MIPYADQINKPSEEEVFDFYIKEIEDQFNYAVVAYHKVFKYTVLYCIHHSNYVTKELYKFFQSRGYDVYTEEVGTGVEFTIYLTYSLS